MLSVYYFNGIIFRLRLEAILGLLIEVSNRADPKHGKIKLKLNPKHQFQIVKYP